MSIPKLKIDIVGENIPPDEVEAIAKTILDVIKASKTAVDVVSKDGVILSYVHRENGEVSDGYHSFNDLYKHRHALFISLLCNMADNNKAAWFSKLHHDNTFYPGWIIAGCYVKVPIKDALGTIESYVDQQIRYHLPESYIPHLKACGCVELNNAVEWDGSNSNDTIDRLLMAYGSYDALLAEKKEEASKRIANIPLLFKSIGG